MAFIGQFAAAEIALARIDRNRAALRPTTTDERKYSSSDRRSHIEMIFRFPVLTGVEHKKFDAKPPMFSNVRNSQAGKLMASLDQTNAWL